MPINLVITLIVASGAPLIDGFISMPAGIKEILNVVVVVAVGVWVLRLAGLRGGYRTSR